jgi:hypothetical protein
MSTIRNASPLLLIPLLALLLPLAGCQPASAEAAARDGGADAAPRAASPDGGTASAPDWDDYRDDPCVHTHGLHCY